MIVIIGLGNPGAKYENTRHNIGFITLDRLAERHGISITKSKHHALIGDGFIAGKKVMLVKPQTFMNDSGVSVRELVDYYDVEDCDFAIVYDDVDLPMGRLRIRGGGSAGTHNGMRSIIRLLGYDSFPRFRIGIGAEREYMALADYVLSNFTSEQLDPMRAVVDRCVDAIEEYISHGITEAMQKYNEKNKRVVKEDTTEA